MSRHRGEDLLVARVNTMDPSTNSAPVPALLRRKETETDISLAAWVGNGEHDIRSEFHADRRQPVIHLSHIHSLSHFQRNSKALIKTLKKSGQPAVLTVNGRAELVVQDAASYQKLLDELDRLETIEGIRRGLESMKRGEGRPVEEVLEEVRRKLKLPPGAWNTKSA